ncbi:MAG: tRNA (adenosine(37)-N6)-threonylcarbamoyltransferase complex dimerization subunit type 1 TsaB [Flavobacteriales bacterium]|nr:tRNA (adenosine(37)-N6)-threonylcarbamoyltransferase complex dimerization subunit type 1 TsaB [Flavobacteriales bacterium]|tara:strand:- start:2884 stop:3540 length:657 start_codon:yes stop_codon:yes gene_type:complete
MALILNLETSSKNCSVALFNRNDCISFKEICSENYSHSENLATFIKDVVDDYGVSFSDISAISISKGPGSYTGLRIGMASAKGLCYALSIPLIGLNSLEIMTCQVLSNNSGFDLFRPMINSRKNEVYTALYDINLNLVEPIASVSVHQDSFNTNHYKKVICFGTGSEKVKNIIPNGNFLLDIMPSARSMGSMSFQKFSENDFEDVAYCDPFYLKEAIV